MTVDQIDARIAELRAQLDNPPQQRAEVYSRIVGYYRVVDNWNPGKREEYRRRQEFSAEAQVHEKHLDAHDKRTTFRPDQAGALPIVGQFTALSLGNAANKGSDDDWDLGERDEAATQYEVCESCQ